MDAADCLKILQSHNQCQVIEHGQWAQQCSCGVPKIAGLAEESDSLIEEPEDESDKPLPQGQILDINTGANETLSGLESVETLLGELPELEEIKGNGSPALETEADATARFRQSSSSSLVESVLEQHQQRVVVHKAYDAAFKRILERGSIAVSLVYPSVVTAATQRFSTISLLVRSAATVLAERDVEAKEAARLIRRLQALEKERLTLVAAGHLDRVRYLDQIRSKGMGADRGPGDVGLADGIDVRQKLQKMDTEIEETISELRHARTDLQEEEVEES